jgi:hypothetical protein
MKMIARTVAAFLLLTVGLGMTGCIHTLTQTYSDYPPSAWDPPHSRSQGNPSDG